MVSLGLDETLMGRRGPFRAKAWSTSIVDAKRGQSPSKTKPWPPEINRLGRTLSVASDFA